MVDFEKLDKKRIFTEKNTKITKSNEKIKEEILYKKELEKIKKPSEDNKEKEKLFHHLKSLGYL